MLNRMVDLDKIPDEVMWVLRIPNGWPVGRETFEKVQKIIDKYPKYFPWERTFKSIPKEVHDAYVEEKKMTLMNYIEVDNGIERGDGIRQQVEKNKPVDTILTKEMYEEFINSFAKDEEERIEKRKKEKALWDKHYKIYGLEYKG